MLDYVVRIPYLPDQLQAKLNLPGFTRRGNLPGVAVSSLKTSQPGKFAGEASHLGKDEAGPTVQSRSAALRIKWVP